MSKRIIITEKEKTNIQKLYENITEQGVFSGFKRGKEEGEKMSGNNEEKPIETEEYHQTTIKRYNDYITVEATTSSGNRETAQKMITKTAEDKKLGEQTRRQVFSLESGGYKLIAYFNK